MSLRRSCGGGAAHNYIGHSHNYIGHNYIGHDNNYVSVHNYKGHDHNYIGHNHIYLCAGVVIDVQPNDRKKPVNVLFDNGQVYALSWPTWLWS